MGKSAKKQVPMKKTPLKIGKAKAKAATKKKPWKKVKNPCNKEKKPLQEGKQPRTKHLNKKNLEKLGELTLGERVAMAAEEETEEAAVESLKAGMTKKDHSQAWGQHNTWLKKQPKEEQEAHAKLDKKEKGAAVCLWLLKKNVARFQHHSQEVKGSSAVLQKERWVSLKTILKQWSEDELDAHLESGRILARQCKKNPGVWEYCDTEDEEKIRKASKIKSLKQGQEYVPDENDDEEFGNMWQSSGHSQMQRLCDDKGKGGAKGSGKALREGPGKGKKRGLLALKDKEEEEEEEKGMSWRMPWRRPRGPGTSHRAKALTWKMLLWRLPLCSPRRVRGKGWNKSKSSKRCCSSWKLFAQRSTCLWQSWRTFWWKSANVTRLQRTPSRSSSTWPTELLPKPLRKGPASERQSLAIREASLATRDTGKLAASPCKKGQSTKHQEWTLATRVNRRKKVGVTKSFARRLTLETRVRKQQSGGWTLATRVDPCNKGELLETRVWKQQSGIPLEIMNPCNKGDPCNKGELLETRVWKQQSGISLEIMNPCNKGGPLQLGWTLATRVSPCKKVVVKKSLARRLTLETRVCFWIASPTSKPVEGELWGGAVQKNGMLWGGWVGECCRAVA